MLKVPGGSTRVRECAQLHCLPSQAGHLEAWLLICKMGAMMAP